MLNIRVPLQIWEAINHLILSESFAVHVPTEVAGSVVNLRLPTPQHFLSLLKQFNGFHDPYELYDVQYLLGRDGLPGHKL